MVNYNLLIKIVVLSCALLYAATFAIDETAVQGEEDALVTTSDADTMLKIKIFMKNVKNDPISAMIILSICVSVGFYVSTEFLGNMKIIS